jgi:hypothetical protein
MLFIDSASSDAEVGAERERGCGGSLSDEPSFLYNATSGRIQEFVVSRLQYNVLSSMSRLCLHAENRQHW